MRRVGLASLVALAGLCAAACRGAPTTPTAATTQPPVAAPHEATSALAAAKGIPPVHPVLDDPRLAEARAYDLARDYANAAVAMERAHASLAAPLAPAEECAWAYLTGRYYLAASDPANAAVQFDRVTHPKAESGPAPACELAPYANLRAAAAYLKAHDPTTAVDRAKAVPPDIAAAADARLTLANALGDAGRPADAVPLWRELLAKEPRMWIDVACRLAAALLDGADGPPEKHAAEAYDLVTRVIVEAPKIETTSGAVALRARALALTSPKEAKAKADLSVEQHERRAKTWLDAGEPKKALAEIEPLWPALGKSTPEALACDLALTRAQSAGRAKLPSAPEAWGNAIDRCAHGDALVVALYQGAKAATGKEPLVAAERFARVEKEFPTHRLADDARFQGALLALGQGDEARFTQMMLSLPDDYPGGDMRGEALFRAALLKMTKGDWAGAAPILDRIEQLFPDDRHWATAGRAAYFRARAAAAMGQRDDALRRFVDLVEKEPLAFYMTQSYARVAAEDPGLARRTVDLALTREAAGELLTREHAELATPAFQRAIRLLEVGDTEAAKREVALSGATADGADPEMLWAVGLVYDLAGAPELGHAFARARVTDHLAHYPGGRYRTLWQIAYPRAFQAQVEAESRTRAIPPALTWAIMREESDFYPDAKSASNAYGLMQLISSTARGVALGTPYGFDEVALKRPDASIALGAKLLGGLRAEFSTNPSLAIAAYNAGGGAVGRWLAARGEQDFDLWVEQIPFDETRGYIKRVLSSEAAYGLLYDRPAFDEVTRIALRASGARAKGAGASE